MLAVAAVLVVVAVMAAMTWGMGVPATGGLGTENANLKAGPGSAVVHDDAGNIPLTGSGSALVNDDAGNMPIGAGSAIAHDDAGNVRPR